MRLAADLRDFRSYLRCRHSAAVCDVAEVQILVRKSAISNVRRLFGLLETPAILLFGST